jgi:sucrose-6-phosphate hydrolase SacC (GH32 family)
MAWSSDRGRTWTKSEGNPVVGCRAKGNRDPTVFWHEASNQWVMALYLTRGQFMLYGSKNLTDWTELSEVACPDGYECPEFFELPVDGDAKNTRWVVFAGNAQYVIGSFDGKTFTPDHEGRHRVHYGAYYASQCFSNPPDGRVVQMGWARVGMPGMPFNQTFSVPTNLTLHTTADGIRMFATPIKELEALRKPNPKTVEDTALSADKPNVEVDAPGQLSDILVTLKKGTAAKAVLRFGENAVTYDFGARKLDEMPLEMKDGRVTFRILVDRPMVEVCGGGGACYKTSGRRDQGKPLGTISLTAEGGSVTVESLEVYEMTSAWK